MSHVTDPIGDLLTRIRNAQQAKHASCTAPASRMLRDLCELLKKEGWISDVKIHGESPKQELEVIFDPTKKLTLKRISKPGRRLYSGAQELKPVLQGFGISVLTTSQGLMTDTEARAKGIGGEVLCTIS